MNMDRYGGPEAWQEYVDEIDEAYGKVECIDCENHQKITVMESGRCFCVHFCDRDGEYRQIPEEDFHKTRLELGEV